MDLILFIYDIFTQQHWLLAKCELIFTNRPTYIDHVKSSDASLRQYIFLQIRIYSMLKYPLQLTSLEVPNFIQQGLFIYLQKERKVP